MPADSTPPLPEAVAAAVERLRTGEPPDPTGCVIAVPGTWADDVVLVLAHLDQQAQRIDSLATALYEAHQGLARSPGEGLMSTHEDRVRSCECDDCTAYLERQTKPPAALADAGPKGA